MSEEPRKFFLNGVEVTEEEMNQATVGTEKQEVSEPVVEETVLADTPVLEPLPASENEPAAPVTDVVEERVPELTEEEKLGQ